MSSAIEVLKQMIDWEEENVPNRKRALTKAGVLGEYNKCYSGEDELNALKEAIVALEQKENYVIDFIRLESLPKSKKEKFRVFFKDGTEQVFQLERVGEQK